MRRVCCVIQDSGEARVAPRFRERQSASERASGVRQRPTGDCWQTGIEMR